MMQGEDEYRTIAAAATARLRERGSVFLAQAVPVASRDEADRAVHAIAAEHHDASHHCFSYRLGPDGAEFRAQDAGEPSGSAGKPILGAIDHFGLTNVLVVVTRWFGGTKLGVGGLVRAYGEAARAALAASGVRTVVITQTLEVDFPHEATSAVMRTLARHGALVRDTRYDDIVHLTAAVRRSAAAACRDGLIEETRGQARVRDAGGASGP
jgi:uncharacterized YigZ family protein